MKKYSKEQIISIGLKEINNRGWHHMTPKQAFDEWRSLNTKTIKKAKKKKVKPHQVKIKEVKAIEVEKYSHPLLGKEEYSKFYQSIKWKQLRYLALRNTNGVCQCCGAKASDGVQLHVDHIKPRSRYPELELSLDNLQVLCDDCNIGKGDWGTEDWREHWKSLN